MLTKRKGMTLVEIIVAMAVFAIVVMSILNVFPIVARLNVISKAGVDLTAIAQTEAERFYAYSRTNTYNESLTFAMAEPLNYVKTLSTDVDGINDILTRYVCFDNLGIYTVPCRIDGINRVTIVVTFWNNIPPRNNIPSTGMTKIRVLATFENNYNYKGASSQQIDSILLFK